jgi:hypothetical protein
MPEDDSMPGDAGCIVTLSIQPISIQLTSTHVLYSPTWPPGDGVVYSREILTVPNSQSLASIISATMPDSIRCETTINGEPLKKFILYSIEITVEIYFGLLGQKDGTGLLRRKLSRIIPMRNFWKPGFMMTMELDLSNGYPLSLISVYNYSTKVTQQKRLSSGH